MKDLSLFLQPPILDEPWVSDRVWEIISGYRLELCRKSGLNPIKHAVMLEASCRC